MNLTSERHTVAALATSMSALQLHSRVAKRGQSKLGWTR
jgi:hypothetical protein